MPQNTKITDANNSIRRVTLAGIIVNIGLGIIKVIVGLIVHSIALVADGVHSISDLFSDIAVLLGIHFGSKQADKNHPYGHGRIETFSAFLIATGLVALGAYMIYYAAMDIAAGNISRPSIAVIFISVISVILKELLYIITKRVAVKLDSAMLYANAWHHRADALSSLAVIAGVIAAFMGFEFGDQLAAVAVGMMIIIAGAGIIGKCFREISETSVDDDLIEKIKQLISTHQGVIEWHKLRTRTVGREVFIDVHILVQPHLTITHAHDISENLENTMHTEITRPVNIIIHIEPIEKN